MPEQTRDELLDALDHANVEVKRWKTIATVLAERLRELGPTGARRTPICGRQRCKTPGWLPCERPEGHEGDCEFRYVPTT
jgi:hypothetical protein